MDVGFAGYSLQRLLVQAGVGLPDIQAVFLTHEHFDHIAGLPSLPLRVPIFANRITAQAVKKRLKRAFNWHYFETGVPFAFQDIEVHPFTIPHDAAEPVGYSFQFEEACDGVPKRLAWLTDLGHVTEAIKANIREVQVLVIESNYDPDLLARHPSRSWALKQRIQGLNGHLSNYDTAAVLQSMPEAAWRQVYLSHISRECNTIECIHAVFEPLLKGQQAFKLAIVPPVKNLLPELIW